MSNTFSYLLSVVVVVSVVSSLSLWVVVVALASSADSSPALFSPSPPFYTGSSSSRMASMNISCGVFFLLPVELPPAWLGNWPSTNLSLPQLKKSFKPSLVKDAKPSKFSGSLANYTTKKANATALAIRRITILESSSLRSKLNIGLNESIISFYIMVLLKNVQKIHIQNIFT